jgi:hypothetical protein
MNQFDEVQRLLDAADRAVEAAIARTQRPLPPGDHRWHPHEIIRNIAFNPQRDPTVLLRRGST